MLDPEFLDWLEDITYFLPPSMSVHEAKQLYDRKKEDEKEIEE